MARARGCKQAPPDLWLLFAPLKKARTDFVVEKAIELGASEIRPVLTERTDADTVRTDRLQRIAIEAAEQTERLDVPPVREAVKLDQALIGWNADRASIYADEAGDEGGKPWGGEAGRAPPIADMLNEPEQRQGGDPDRTRGRLQSGGAQAPARAAHLSSPSASAHASCAPKRQPLRRCRFSRRWRATGG